jgi:transcriptional regulator with XRE-family HTH domain
MDNNSDPILLSFGYSLRHFRKAKMLSQEDLGLKSGLDRTYISGLERGKRNPTLKIINILAKNLEIPISYLVSENQNEGDCNENQEE